MEMIADIMLIAAALGAGLYCVTLSRRLTRFNSLENGVGGAIAVLSAQVDGMTKTLENARGTAQTERETLDALTNRAEEVARKLELLVASMHDLPIEQENGEIKMDGSEQPETDSEPVPTPAPGAKSETERPATATMFASRRKAAS